MPTKPVTPPSNPPPADAQQRLLNSLYLAVYSQALPTCVRCFAAVVLHQWVQDVREETNPKIVVV